MGAVAEFSQTTAVTTASMAFSSSVIPACDSGRGLRRPPVVPLSEIAFAVLLLPYLLVLARLAFPQGPGKPNPAAPVFPDVGGRLHLVVGAALPALYILNGLRAGDTAGVAAAAPHAFLLSAQVFTEGIVATWPGVFSLPVRAAVPVIYNAPRMFAVSE